MLQVHYVVLNRPCFKKTNFVYMQCFRLNDVSFLCWLNGKGNSYLADCVGLIARSTIRCCHGADPLIYGT